MLIELHTHRNLLDIGHSIYLDYSAGFANVNVLLSIVSVKYLSRLSLFRFCSMGQLFIYEGWVQAIFILLYAVIFVVGVGGNLVSSPWCSATSTCAPPPTSTSSTSPSQTSSCASVNLNRLISSRLHFICCLSVNV